jgi:hypothetical protein
MTRPRCTSLVLLLALALAPASLADSPGGDELPMKAKSKTTEGDAAAVTPAAAPEQALPSGRSLLRAHVEASGGTKALENVQNAVVTAGYAIPAQNMSGTITIAFARPDKILSRGEMTGVGRMEQGFDGTTGWEINALTGPRLLGSLELEQLRNSESNVFNLESLERLYADATTVGRGTFAGRPAWEVRLTSTTGRETTAWFDAATSLMIGMKTTVASQLGEIPATITLSDYKSFGGMKLPTKSTQSLLNGVVEATSTIQGVELNVPAERLPSFAPPAEILELKAEAAAGSSESSAGE